MAAGWTWQIVPTGALGWKKPAAIRPERDESAQRAKTTECVAWALPPASDCFQGGFQFGFLLVAEVGAQHRATEWRHGWNHLIGGNPAYQQTKRGADKRKPRRCGPQPGKIDEK